jgi:hypothetical protein
MFYRFILVSVWRDFLEAGYDGTVAEPDHDTFRLESIYIHLLDPMITF